MKIELMAFFLSIIVIIYNFIDTMKGLKKKSISDLENKYNNISDQLVTKKEELNLLLQEYNNIVDIKEKQKNQLIIEKNQLINIEEVQSLSLEKEYILKKKKIDKKIQLLYKEKYFQDLISIFLKEREKNNLEKDLKIFFKEIFYVNNLK
ncbi:hypothetical protein AB836_01550 [Rickettsiales bacterium (ex Bugula neritina AB1)]|nr:hypothetical protein AB836_01550 [Rickettsiales bacterium (ex Bugula neritina AB1)]